MSSPASLTALYVTMVFPAPSEAFAGVELRALRQQGIQVRVAALRTPHRMHEQLLRDWGLQDVEVTHTTLGGLASLLLDCLRHPIALLDAIAWNVRLGWRRPASLLRSLLLVPRCVQIFGDCKRRPPDVVQLFWGHYPATVGHLVLRWLPRVHVATSLGAYDLLLEHAPGLDVARRAHSVWTQTSSNLEHLSRCGIDPSRVQVLVRGVDAALAGPLQARAADAAVVVVSRLEANKGVDDAIRAFATAAASHPAVRLLVIGEGPEMQALRALAQSLGIAERTDFLGACAHTEVFHRLRSANAFLLLSRNPSERLPNAVKEALACGCVCVVTRTPGIEQLLGHLAAPCIVEQGDWQGAARLLEHVLRDPQSYDADRQAGRDFVLTQLDAANAALARINGWTQPQDLARCAA